MKALALFGLAVCFFALGCDDSKNPLSDPQKSKADEKLIGVWRHRTKDGEETFYHVGRAGDKFPKGMMRIVEIAHAKGEVGPPTEYLAFPTVVGDKKYLNVVWEEKLVRQLDENGWKADGIPGYSFVKYQLVGNDLTVFLMDDPAKAKAIKDGKIKGEKHGNDLAMFTDSTENVARFIAAADAGLWNTAEAVSFERVELGKRP
jgi:hypothetical protein